MINLNKKWPRISVTVSEAYDILALLFILVLPFSAALPNIILGALLLLYCIDFNRECFLTFVKSPFIVLTILLLILFAQAIYTNSFVSDFTYYRKHLYLLAMPILFFKVNNLRLIKKATLIAVCAMILVSVYRIIKFYMVFKFFPFAEGWATNFVLLLERPYAGLFAVIAMIISVDLFFNTEKKKHLYIMSFFLCFGFVFMISIRTSILTFLLLFLIYIVFYLRATLRRKALFLLGLFLTVSLFVFLNKNIAKRFYIKNSFSESIENTQKFEPRVVIYGCVENIIQGPNFSFWNGEDSYQALQKKLNDCYGSSINEYGKRNWFLDENFNTHNQFIDFFLIGGIIPFLLFVLFLTWTLVCVYKNFAATAIVLSFTMVLLIENLFHRQFGCFLFAVFLSIYFKTAKFQKTTENHFVP